MILGSVVRKGQFDADVRTPGNSAPLRGVIPLGEVSWGSVSVGSTVMLTVIGSTYYIIGSLSAPSSTTATTTTAVFLSSVSGPISLTNGDSISLYSDSGATRTIFLNGALGEIEMAGALKINGSTAISSGRVGYLSQLSVSPSSTMPPFTLGSNAQGQTVVGLRADQLNKSIVAGDGLDGGGLFTSDLLLSVNVTGIIDETKGLTSTNNDIQINAGFGLDFDLNGKLEIDQSLIPTWTGSHTFQGGIVADSAITGTGTINLTGVGDNSLSGKLGLGSAPSEMLDVNGNVLIRGTYKLILGSDVELYRSGADILSLSTGDVFQSPSFTSGYSGFHIAEDYAEFNNVVTRGELRSSVFAYDEIHAAGGSLLIAEASIVLSTATTATSFTIDVKDPVTGHIALFSVNDILRIKFFDGNNVRDIWGTITAVTDSTTYYTYTLTLESGTAGVSIPPGTAVVNYGPSGSGGILLTSDSANSPRLDIFTHSGSPWTSLSPHVRLGNLNSFLDYSTDIYGIGIGDSNAFMSYDPTNGLRLINSVIRMMHPLGPGIQMQESGLIAYDADGFPYFTFGADSTSGDIYLHLGTQDRGLHYEEIDGEYVVRLTAKAIVGEIEGTQLAATSIITDIAQIDNAVIDDLKASTITAEQIEIAWADGEAGGGPITLSGGIITAPTIRTADTGARIEITQTDIVGYAQNNQRQITWHAAGEKAGQMESADGSLIMDRWGIKPSGTILAYRMDQPDLSWLFDASGWGSHGDVSGIYNWTSSYLWLKRAIGTIPGETFNHTSLLQFIGSKPGYVKITDVSGLLRFASGDEFSIQAVVYPFNQKEMLLLANGHVETVVYYTGSSWDKTSINHYENCYVYVDADGFFWFAYGSDDGVQRWKSSTAIIPYANADTTDKRWYAISFRWVYGAGTVATTPKVPRLVVYDSFTKSWSDVSGTWVDGTGTSAPRAGSSSVYIGVDFADTWRKMRRPNIYDPYVKIDDDGGDNTLAYITSDSGIKLLRVWRTLITDEQMENFTS